MTPPRLARTALAGLLLATAGALLAGCSDDAGSGEGSADGSPTAPATGAPFGAEFVGPNTADPGEEITATITNTGRLPDAFQLSVEPPRAATFDQQDFTLSPEESIDVRVTIEDTPLVLVLKSVGGGGGERVADLEIN
ncbi:MAG: hypothetical protein ACRDOM_08285 [Nocardioides sp.]